ncbi:capsular polysaccharide export protein, LipB/KpsS family [Enterovibrio norvegicus]|uniref:capsular polysaccharide export protein, LipB/KpsS family n=1 Tax=Enterovibrio norvegicus TaxID=188144 RepID=UPI00352F3A56
MSKEIRLITLDPPYSKYFRHLVKNLEGSEQVGFKKHYVSALGYLAFGVKDSTLIKTKIVNRQPSFSSRKTVVGVAKELGYELNAKSLHRSAQYVEWLKEEIVQNRINTCLLYNATRFNHALAITLFQQMGVSYYVFERGTQRGKTTTLLSNPLLASLPNLNKSLHSHHIDAKHYGTESLSDYVLFFFFLMFDGLGRLLRLNFESPDKALRKKRYSKIFFQWMKAKRSPDPQLNGKYLLVPLQLEYDSQVRCFSDFSSTQEFINTVELGFYRSSLKDEYVLVFTTHPFECNKHSFDVRSQCFSGKTGVLMEDASAIVTINSTAGFEAIEKLKPCFVFGEALYKDKSVVIPTTTATFTDNLELWKQNGWQPLRQSVERMKFNILASTQVQGSVYKYDAEALELAKRKIVS